MIYETEITLEHQQQIERIRRAAGHCLSSHAFASLYLWQDQMKLRLCMLQDAYAVRCGGGWFFPCGAEAGVRAFLEALPSGAALFYLRKEDKLFLESAYPGQYCLERHAEADEYIYDIPEHMRLAGKPYANMRTQVHKVERDHALRTELISPENTGHALGIIREWKHGERRFAGCGLRDDEVDMEALRRREELGITGVIVYLNDVPSAVAAGFPLTDDTFDIAVAKCRNNAQGLSYYAKRALMAQVQDRFRLMNLEEDLGIPGLKRMKRNMRPIAMNEVWKAVRK